MKKIIIHLKSEWYKYVLETLVVVVGILVAFTLNNWNENRKDRGREKILLSELIRNLNTNVASIEKSLEADKFRQGITEYIIQHLSNKKPFNDSLNFFGAIHTENINIVSSSFSTMKSIGLDIVKNDTLREVIVNLYEVLYVTLHERARYIQQTEFQSSLLPLWNKYFRLIEGKLVPNDYSDLLNNQEVFNVYSRILFWRSVSIDAKLNSIEDTKKLISMIELELSN